MMPADTDRVGRGTSLAITLPWVALCGLFMLLYFRNSGLYPIVFTDEWVYSKGARLTPLAEATAPSYLYLAIYGITKSCGRDFLDCARLLNVFFFLSAVPLVYLVARKASSRTAATTVAILTALSPFNSYTAYFMPEAMYFFCFWLFVWLSIQYAGKGRDAGHATTGILVGIMTLVKVHAFFLALGYIVFILLTRLQSRGAFSAKWFAHGIVVFVAALLAVRLTVGYLLAGTDGLNLTGSDYAPNAAALLSVRDYPRLLWLAVQNLGGHFLALAALFALPMASLPGMLARTSAQDPACATDPCDPRRAVATLALAIFVPLVAITALYAASIAGVGPYESIGRIHARYYNFAFPLLLIIAASQIQSVHGAASAARARHIVPAVVVGIALLYAMFTGMTSYTLSIVDCPELAGVLDSPTAFILLALAGLAAVVIWLFRRALGARMFLYVLMPAIVAIASTHATVTMRQRALPDAYDQAGIFAHSYLDRQAASKLLVAGAELGYLYRTLFHVDNPHAAVMLLPGDSKIDVGSIGSDRDWLLLVGNNARIDAPEFEISGAGYRLIKLARDRNIDFSKATWPGVVARTNGLSNAESMGTWSVARVVTIELSSVLPRSFVVRLNASAYGPNVGQAFRMRIGRIQKSFTLTETPGELQIAIDDSDDGVRVLEIDVPQPTSPKSLGLSEDARALGIALKSLVIEPARKPDRK